MEEEDNNSVNVIGYILAFGFTSVVMLFITIVFFASINNYAIGRLYNIVNDFVSNGIIPSSFSSIADSVVSNIPQILSVLDYVWLSCFIIMVAGTLYYSYNTPRKNYFNIFTMAILGLIIFLWVGSYITQVTQWFVTEIYNKVLPSISTYTPILNWYLDNINLINLVLVSLNIIANFVDLDFSKYYRRKNEENVINEI